MLIFVLFQVSEEVHELKTDRLLYMKSIYLKFNKYT